jgi:Pentapeptide repeats (8 copies)
MANDEHVKILKKGMDAWNAWRNENLNILPDLAGVNLRGADLSGMDLYHSNLSQANLSGANLIRANLWLAKLRGADLSGAYLDGANLSSADLIGANLGKAILRDADLSGAHLRGANLRGANLNSANLVETRLTDADLTGCRIYGVAAWGLKLQGAKQQNLIITTNYEPEVTVDNIEVAQFIYLLLHNEKIRDVINTITSKVVLILGRFAAERKAVLDALREELRKRDLLPILFDFAIPASRDVTETIKTLASLGGL